ncbi:uncharacterized protein [Watersipora subatra]
MLESNQIAALLESVKRKPPLYNFDPLRRARESHLRVQLWEEVGHELNASAELCKETWQTLRTKFRLQMARKEQVGASSWRWFEDMEFFVPHLASFPSTKHKMKKTPGVAKKHWRHSLTEGLKKYKQNSISKPLEKRRSMPAYAAKSTSQVPSWVTSPPVLPNPKSSPGLIEKHSSYSPPVFAFRTPAQQNDSSQFKEPLALTSLDEDNSISVKSSEKKTLEDYKEYHFVCCVMEMLEEVPLVKRNMVKAKIMAEIASAYQ